MKYVLKREQAEQFVEEYWLGVILWVIAFFGTIIAATILLAIADHFVSKAKDIATPHQECTVDVLVNQRNPVEYDGDTYNIENVRVYPSLGNITIELDRQEK